MKNMGQAKIALAVTNDLVTDQRVHRIASTLSHSGNQVLLIGRLLPNSKPLAQRDYNTHRMKLRFTTGPLFYLFYNLRLFLFLLPRRFTVIISNDLDTLLACFLVSKFKKTRLVFDSHELFTEVPELTERPRIQKIWLNIEKRIVPKLKYNYTVCDSLAHIFQEKYKTNFITIRNLPYNKSQLPLPELANKTKGKKIILYQGSVNIGRGLELVINTLPLLENTVFIIVGRGDIETQLKNLAEKVNVTEKVIFTGPIPFEQLHPYTQMAHLGISLEENMGKNYFYALPNKIFDYTQALVPVLTSDFPEMRKIIDTYNIGKTTKANSPKELAPIIKEMLSNHDKRAEWNNNLQKAKEILCWENEEKKLIDFLVSNNLIDH